MKKQIIFFSALLCLIVNLSSCNPEAISYEQDTHAIGGNEIDDPAEPDEED